MKLTRTNERAMGNAFLVSAVEDVIVLADGGEMQLFRALREKCGNIPDYRRINNADADFYQRDGLETFRIEEE